MEINSSQKIIKMFIAAGSLPIRCVDANVLGRLSVDINHSMAAKKTE